MCCFSGKVQSVNNTRIFARMGAHGNQVIAYSMALKTRHDVAMILPVPVNQKAGGPALKFISLEKYPQFFEDLAYGYNGGKSVLEIADPRTLKVESVGAYDASYGPAIADFSRLDPRFRLPTEVWERLPGYRDFGFAVFKLKKGRTDVHPMAFSFASAKPHSLFFPTVHIHDGRVHDRAEFDHTLYAQQHSADEGLHWDETPQLAGQFMKTARAEGLVKPNQHVYRRQMSGKLRNIDVLVPLRMA